MKLTSGSAGSGREQMRERQRRDRSATPLMRARYPKFASLRLDFMFVDSAAFTPAPQVTVLHPPARAYFSFPCPYSDCDGEFDLSTVVEELARSGETQAGAQLKCCGRRARGGEGRVPCQLVLEYTVNAQVE
jgi:hypothetical protein